MKLKQLLQSADQGYFSLVSMRSEELKKACRVWVGKEAGSYNKGRCIAALTQAFQDDGAARRVLATLSDLQMRVLAIVGRFGPSMSGGILTAEIYARGIRERDKQGGHQDTTYAEAFRRRQNDPVRLLCESLLLTRTGGYWDPYDSMDKRYPGVALQPILVKIIEPAPPLPWKIPQDSVDDWNAHGRSFAEAALELGQVASALQSMGTWAMLQGNAPSKAARIRLHKDIGLRDAAVDVLSPPDPELFYYELLRGLGVLDFPEGVPQLRQDVLDRHLEQSPALQAWQWVRAWLSMHLWQDGIGGVPDRDSDQNPVRIEPGRLRKMREFLVWALCRVAHAPAAWLDLETFLEDLRDATQESPLYCSWDSYTWNPEFKRAGIWKGSKQWGERVSGLWLDQEGAWAANAVWVTLVAIGLVNRGVRSAKSRRPCFQLTELGRVVFGAPEVDASQEHADARFLTVQPNLEVLAYLDSADARQLCTLARFAVRESAPGGQVLTFALRRESVYRALESGMRFEAIRAFLEEHGKTDLPANVARILSEWAGKRESMVLRTNVSVALGRAGTALSGRSLSENVVLLRGISAKKAAQDYPGWRLLDHCGEFGRAWAVDELGSMTSTEGDSISRQRFAILTDAKHANPQITQESIAVARERGLDLEQILGWLRTHLSHGVPELLEMAIRNWVGRQTVSVSRVHLLKVSRTQAYEAILGSRAFQPMLAGFISPEWLVIRDDQVREACALLEMLGFSISSTFEPSRHGQAPEAQGDTPGVIVRLTGRSRRTRRD